MGTIELLNIINECMEALQKKGIAGLVVIGESEADKLMIAAVQRFVKEWGELHKSVSMIEAMVEQNGSN